MNACLDIAGKPVQTVIFDFDGTLALLNIDFQTMRSRIEDLLLTYGLSPHLLAHLHILEMIRKASSIISADLDSDAQRFTKEAFAILEIIEMDAARQGALFGETRPLLTLLRHHRIKTGIITRNCAKALFCVFPDILDHCPVVVTREDVNFVKPHPEHLTRALTLLDASAKTTLMIGDHPLDIQTGLDAGTLAAGVLTGHHAPKDFADAGAHYVWPSAFDLAGFLDGNGSI